MFLKFLTLNLSFQKMKVALLDELDSNTWKAYRISLEVSATFLLTPGKKCPFIWDPSSGLVACDFGMYQSKIKPSWRPRTPPPF